MRADEGAHILDDAEHRHVHLAEHVEPLARVDQREVLRRRDDDRAGERHLLRHGELRVAGAGRHVDDEHVELAPGDVLQHLRQRRHHHRPAPDHRRLLVDEEAHRHHLQPISLHRRELVAVELLRLALDAEQPRHRRPVNVGIEHADPEAALLAAPSARLTAVVDLPTPPLPEATAMMLATPGTPPGRWRASRAAPRPGEGRALRGCAPGPCRCRRRAWRRTRGRR